MLDYIIAYRGGNPPATPEAGAAHKAKWQAWVEGLGKAAVNPGTPLMNTRIVSAAGVSEEGGPEALSGFTVVRVENLEAALEMAKRCPFLEIGGTLQVAQMVEM